MQYTSPRTLSSTLAAALLFAACSAPQRAPVMPGAPSYEPSGTDFGDDTVAGDLSSPDGTYVESYSDAPAPTAEISAPMAAPPPSAMSRAAPSRQPSSRPPQAPPSGTPASGTTTQQQAHQPAQARMVFYHGQTRLRCVSVDDTLARVEKRAVELGGHLESRTRDSINVRVPVDAFQAFFAEVLELGDVLDKLVWSEDLTEAFTAVTLRLRTLKATRERLVALLAQAKTEHEKLALLEQIRGLTQQIDSLEAQQATLAKLAAFSRVSVQAVPRRQGPAKPQQESIAAFKWIWSLSPMRRDVARAAQRLELPVPEGLVTLSKDGPWIAESADGAATWSARMGNEPYGSGEFWLSAIEQRLAPEYAKVERSAAGPYSLLRLVDHGPTAPRYWVAVRVLGGELHLVEAYFPSEAQEQRYREAVLQSLQAGATNGGES